jgi:hypothetical protein
VKNSDDYGWLLAGVPGEWIEVSGGGWRQRWLPGAFGDLERLAGELRFQVEEDEWETKDDGTVWRTIKKARVIEASVVS